MVLEFYYDLMSQPCRAVWLFLKATGVPFEDHVISLFKRDHYSPEFTKKNPFKKIPLINDDGFILTESAAIMRYLAVKYNVAEHWYPTSDPQHHAKVDEFLNWQHVNVRKVTLEVFIPTFRSRIGVGERFPKQPLDPVKVDAAKAELAKSVQHIDEYFLKGKPFIAGAEISAADLSGVCELIHLTAIMEEGCYENNENVKAWVKRVQDRLQPYFEEANVSVKALGEKFKAAGES